MTDLLEEAEKCRMQSLAYVGRPEGASSCVWLRTLNGWHVNRWRPSQVVVFRTSHASVLLAGGNKQMRHDVPWVLDKASDRYVLTN